MKKSSPSACPRVTRITPSAPIPLWRSHTAATNGSVRGRSSGRSSSITKSLPVPWYFQMRIGSATQVLRQVVHEAHRPAVPRLEPADPWVPPEPGELTARERLRALDGKGDRVLQAELPLQVPRHLSVPDGLTRGEPPGEAPLGERAHLLDETARDLLSHASLDPLEEHPARHVDPSGPHRVRVVALPGLREARERPPGQLDHLERADRPPNVVRLDLAGRIRVGGRAPPVGAAGAPQLRLLVQRLAHRRIRRREGQVVHHCPAVKARAPDEQHLAPAA